MPAGATYEPIATTTLASATNTFSFSSISSSYTDLRIIFLARAESTDIYPRIRFNSDTATNYSFTLLYGDGASPFSSRNTNQTSIGLMWNGAGVTTIPSLAVVDIFSYAGSTNKTILNTNSSDRNGSGIVEKTVGLWRSTSAINAIQLFNASGNFAVGTTATLYGIKAA